MTSNKLNTKRVKMRVTKKLLTKLVNEKLAELEIDFEVDFIERSRFRPQDYESGAYLWKANLKKEGKEFYITPYIYSFVPFYELEQALNNGKKITIKNSSFSSNQMLSDLEITYK